MVDLDTLRREQREGRAFGGLREGDLSRFAPTYKRVVGQVDGYSRSVYPFRRFEALLKFSRKRIPGYTDRILFASHTDPSLLFSPQSLLTPTPPPMPATTTQIEHFSSTPEIIISDHKPVHAILTLPDISHSAPAPHLAPVIAHPPPPHAELPAATPWELLMFWKFVGHLVDKAVGLPWCLMILLGFGNLQAGMGVSALVAMIWGVWWSGALTG